MNEALSSMIVHDMKNALALLESDLAAAAAESEHAKKAYRRCVELRNRLVGFLTLYKTERGGLNPVRRDTDLTSFLECVIEESLYCDGEIEFNLDRSRCRIGPGVALRGSAYIDENLVEIALANAIDNAVRYAGSRIDVWFEQDAKEVTFFIRNDGGGARAERGSASTGLGLALCNEVARAHGSEKPVALETDAEGGTVFSMTVSE